MPPTEPVKTEENGVEAPKVEVEDDATAAGFTEISKAGLKELSKSVENIVPLSNEEGTSYEQCIKLTCFLLYVCDTIYLSIYQLFTAFCSMSVFS